MVNMQRISLILLMILLILGFFDRGRAQEQEVLPLPSQTVLVFELGGGITPATVDALDAAITLAESEASVCLLIELDTPGGLVDSMRSMVQRILSSRVPVVVWVGPGGARAASAGVFLVAASHVAAMSPQSTMGAASPVGMGGKEIESTIKTKVVNDLASLVRSLAESRNRNARWYEESVEDAVSITAQEAVMSGVVEYIASDSNDFMTQIAATGGIAFNGSRVPFEGANLKFKSFDPGFRHHVLSWLLQPQIAYLLLLGGIAGLFFEFTTPGAVFPGVFGGMCLLLGLYAMSVLPTNVAGVLLILFALILLVLEVYVTSFGMLGISALVALFFGSTILFSPGHGVSPLPLSLIASTVASVAILMGVCMVLIVKVQRSRSQGGTEAMTEEVATVRVWSSGRGRVFVRGESWKAAGPDSLRVGDRVRIVSVKGLTLSVELYETD
ncbi:NfeD family protein [Desulfovibrio ferrophilus]|uniref:Uncharacterized protein n=1 Tax=Desulfovibrio ferrophilus TaxID=241368 RepID=A0A2Z6B1W7_9BACT|nr:nodulation protein NfeD [Desulfovibrio ferrophilus]BBD09386.1 uncharacterized protein DFE_2660 [Desulfovibrio ferrophilus]